MHYALAKLETGYFKDKVKRFISLAPCVYDSSRTGQWSTSADNYQKLLDLQIYYYGGKDAYVNANKVCGRYGLTSELCEDFRNSVGSHRHAILNELYNDQIWITKRFQEPVKPQDWFDETKWSTLMDKAV